MEINLGKLAFDVDFHPSDNLVATGLIDGDLHLYVAIKVAAFMANTFIYYL